MFDKSKYVREWQKQQKENHRCIQCAKQDQRTLQGFTRCEECAAKMRERNKQHYAEHRLEIISKYKATRAANHQRWLDENRDKWNAYQREYYRKRKAKGAENND